MYSKQNKVKCNKLTDYTIILDLDQTLIYSFEDEELEEIRNYGIFSRPEYLDIRQRIFKLTLEDVMEKKKGVGVKTEIWGIIRPHVKNFLKFCFNHFKIVAVWSAGRRKYVEAIVNLLFKDIQRPHIVYTYDDCDWMNHSVDNKFIIKPIMKMINEIPTVNKYMSTKTTFSLDDTEYTFSHTNKDNGLLIPAYKPKPIPSELRKDDNSLVLLMNWFSKKENMYCGDIRLIKKNIFN